MGAELILWGLVIALAVVALFAKGPTVIRNVANLRIKETDRLARAEAMVLRNDDFPAFERAFRIEELPLAFTLGFSPRPKVSFGLALSVGHESDAEYLDVELAELEALPAQRCN